MEVVVSLILLLTCIAVNADDEGVSDYLQSKWSEYYSVWKQFYPPRCVRTGRRLEDVFVWDLGKGKLAMYLTESEFIGYLTKAYNSKPERFIRSVRRTSTTAIRYADADHNGVVSAEEFYTEHLCMGFGLDEIKKMFDTLKMTDAGIPVDRLVSTMNDFMTNVKGKNQLYDVLKNVSLAYYNATHY